MYYPTNPLGTRNLRGFKCLLTFKNLNITCVTYKRCLSSKSVTILILKYYKCYFMCYLSISSVT